ncbi:MAG: hypothetical protein HKN43_09540 [Rhodothermales bacterium]|nr:hypothetical protein [Rhodothermales bacterium]
MGSPRGMGAVRCNQCGGSGVVYSEDGSIGGPASSGRWENLVVWIFGIFFAIVFANVPMFGLNWLVTGFFGMCIGAGLGVFLSSTRIGRYILAALALAFVVLVIIQLANR